MTEPINLSGLAAAPATVNGLLGKQVLGCLTLLWISAIPAYIAHVTLSQFWEVAKGVSNIENDAHFKLDSI